VKTIRAMDLLPSRVKHLLLVGMSAVFWRLFRYRREA
jgi:hypothetical protein